MRFATFRTMSLLETKLLRTPPAVARVTFLPPCVCLFFPHDVSKSDASRIIKLHIEMFHDGS